jgi:hypothetical protein
MASEDRDDHLREVNLKLQKLLDSGAIARLDRVFSVLLTITIFILGLLLNGTLLVTGLLRAWIIGLLALLIFSLIGEFDAMIKDNDKKRVAYWMTLILGLFISILLLPISLIDFYSLEVVMIVYLTPFSIAYLGLLFWIGRAFPSYFENLPTREFPHKAWKYFGKRIVIGFIIFIVTLGLANYFGI